MEERRCASPQWGDIREGFLEEFGLSMLSLDHIFSPLSLFTVLSCLYIPVLIRDPNNVLLLYSMYAVPSCSMPVPT